MLFSKVMKGLLMMSIALGLMISCSEQQRKRVQSVRAEGAPAYLYKILSVDDWANSCKRVHLSKMDKDFIHFSTEEQLDRIVSKYWADVSEYVVLKVETEKLPGDLRFEANPGGASKYYHLYNGSIPLGAIVEMKVYNK